jgi:hypothetical protein
MIRNCPTDVCTRNLWQRAEMGNKPGTESTTRVPRMSHSEETAQSVPEAWGRTYNALTGSTQGLRKWDKKTYSCAAKTGAKKHVSSNCAKNIKESSN